jgi:hypothetical protein
VEGKRKQGGIVAGKCHSAVKIRLNVDENLETTEKEPSTQEWRREGKKTAAHGCAAVVIVTPMSYGAGTATRFPGTICGWTTLRARLLDPLNTATILALLGCSI